MLQKITYNNSSINSYIYLDFHADHFDLDELTDILGIEPTDSATKRHPVPKSTSWNYKISADDNIDLESPIERLLDLFEPKILAIKFAKEKLGLCTRLQFVVNVEVHPDISTPYFPLNERAIRFLHNTNTTVDFDLYKKDTFGILND